MRIEAAARARGLTTALLAADVLAEIARAASAQEIVQALARAGLSLQGRLHGELASAQLADAVDQLARDRIAADLAILARRTAALAPLSLDEDRRSLRAIVRGIAAGAPAERRIAGAVPTERLPRPLLAELARTDRLDELAAQLARHHHPLAAALALPDTHGDRPLEPTATLELELALARRFAELARPRDRALALHVQQLIDGENAASALLLAARGADLDRERAFLAGGARLSREAFLAAAAAPLAEACHLLASAFAGTPLARAVFEPGPGALEDATLAWQLGAQAQLRRTEPLGLAPAVYVVLRRRDEARQLRRAAWRVALGGAA